MRAFVVFAWMLIGCGSDPCDGKGPFCVSLTLEGSVTMDQIALTVGALHARTAEPHQSTFVPPVRLALELPATTGALVIDVVGALNGAPVARGDASIQMPASGDTQHATVTLEALAADMSAPIDGAMLVDASVPADAGPQIVSLPDETITIPAGWTASVLFDLQGGDWSYNAVDFTDGPDMLPEVVDNAPTVVVALVAPFDDGLAVLAGRQIIELDSGGGQAVHDYAPATPDTAGPDIPRDLFFGDGNLLLASNSRGPGDGIYAIDASWAITTLTSANNDTCVALDQDGVFDDRQAATTYFGSTASENGRLMSFEGSETPTVTIPHAAPEILDVELEPSGNLALVTTVNDTSPSQLAEAISSTDMLRPISAGASANLHLVTGAIDRLAPGIHAVNDMSIMRVVNSSVITIASSQTSGWVWKSAVVPPPTSSYGMKPVYVLLESNRTLNEDRLVLLAPP